MERKMTKKTWFVKGMNRGYIEFLQSKKETLIDINEIKGDTIGFFFSEKEAVHEVENMGSWNTQYPFIVVFPMSSGLFPSCEDVKAERWFKVVDADKISQEYKEVEAVKHDWTTLK